MMFRNRTINKKRRLRDRKTLAVVLATAVAFAYTAAPAYAASDITKEETVYVVTDATGAEEDVIVSDHLKNDIEADTIEDATDLTEIENVKGEETFSQGKGDQIIWNAKGSDIFYEGVSSREIPVTMDISYKLDGEKVDGSQLEGKTGVVEIKIDFKNRAKVNEGGREITVPFIAMCGFIASDDTFQDIEIDHGKVIDDGDKKIVVGMAAPGIADALDIDLDKYDIDLSDSIRITANAKGYDIQDIMTVVTNSVFEDIDTEEMNIDFDDEVNALNDGAKALVEGSGLLYAGIDLVNDNMPELTKGADKLADGSKKLKDGTVSAKDGAVKLDAGANDLKNELTAQMKDMVSGTAKLRDGSKKVLDGLNELKPGLEKIKVGLDGDGTAENPGAIKALTQVEQGLDFIKGKADDTKSTIKSSKSDADYVVTYLKGLKSAYNNLSDTEKQKVNDKIGGDLTSGIDTAIEKAENVAGTIDGVSGDGKNLDQISSAAKNTKDGVTEVKTGLQAASAGLGLSIASLGAYDPKAGMDQTTLIGGQTVVYYGLKELNDQLTVSTGKNGKLTLGLKSLVSGTDSLKQGEIELADGAKSLAKGMNDFKDGVDYLSVGVGALDKGALELSQGMDKFYKEGIEQLVDLYHNDIKGSVDGLRDMISAGQDYRSFTKLPKGMDGNVKFIYKTSIY